MPNDSPPASDDLRSTFQRHLPKRVDAVVRRIEHFVEQGWDINGLSLLHADTQRLAGASGRHGLVEASEQLLAVESLLEKPLRDNTLPDTATCKRLLGVIGRLRELLPVPEDQLDPAVVPTFGDPDRVEVPPPGYWQRWTDDAPPPTPPEAEKRAVAGKAGEGRTRKAARPENGKSGPRAEVGKSDLPAPAVAADAGGRAPQARRVYHLGDGGALSCELDQRLEAAGCEVETLQQAEELKEVLSALPPDLVLVDAAFSAELEAIGAALLPARQRSGAPILLVALVAEDSIETRLAARRARVDAVVVAPADASQVLVQIAHVLEPEREPPYRVLIVEDDRSQGVFAESILRNAGMEATVVDDPMEVLPAMTAFQPDLVLMDLHMPKANGMELTGLIREREEFLHIPIVFLSGESDQDLQFEALEAGGDDFIAKPVRPRHLIAAVQNRVRRARAAAHKDGRQGARDPATGLYRRSWVLDRINHRIDAMLASVGSRPGGVLYLEIEGATQIRERHGLSTLEQLLAEAGRALVERLGETGIAARLGDASFLILAPEIEGESLDSLAASLHHTVASHRFEANGSPIRLRASVGVGAFEHGFADAGALLTAVERACRQARASESGVARFEPPKGGDRAREEALLEQLRAAVEHHTFELLYQPIVAVQGSEEAQYQTLLRLCDDSGALHPAAALIPLAERADLIVEIDRWVIARALAVIGERRTNGRALRLFVPQSTLTLTVRDQPDWLREQLAQCGVDGAALVMEIRLADAVIHLDALKPLARTALELGMQLCLSQYEHLPEAERVVQQLPIGYAKLAERYLKAGTAQAVRDELRVLIDALHRHDIRVIGHQVEDAQAAATLWMSGIDLIQGNLVQQAGARLDFDFDSAVL